MESRTLEIITILLLPRDDVHREVTLRTVKTVNL